MTKVIATVSLFPRCFLQYPKPKHFYFCSHIFTAYSVFINNNKIHLSAELPETEIKPINYYLRWTWKLVNARVINDDYFPYQAVLLYVQDFWGTAGHPQASITRRLWSEGQPQLPRNVEFRSHRTFCLKFLYQDVKCTNFWFTYRLSKFF